MMIRVTYKDKPYMLMEAPNAAEMLGLKPKGSSPLLLVPIVGEVEYEEGKFAPELYFSEALAVDSTMDDFSLLMQEAQNE